MLHSSKLSFNYLDAKIRTFNRISITGFKIDRQGNLKYRLNRVMKNVLLLSEKYAVQIYPLISFQSVSAGRKVLNSKILSKRSITRIKQIIFKYGFPGIHLDFEYLPPRDSTNFARYLKTLKENLSGKKITAAIFPQIGFPKRYSRFHDPVIISPFLDEIVIMCYDMHRANTAPGPVSHIKWAEENIIEIKKYFNPNKIWLGIAAYGYMWPREGKALAISAAKAAKLAVKSKVKRDPSGNLTFNYIHKGKKYIIFFSDSIMREMMSLLVKKYRLAGTALWRIGFEE